MKSAGRSVGLRAKTSSLHSVGKKTNRHIPATPMLNLQKWVAEWAGMMTTTELKSLADAAVRLRRNQLLDANQVIEIAVLLEGIVIRVGQATIDPAKASEA